MGRRAGPPSLAAHHAKLIQDSAVSDEVAQARGYYTETVKAELRRIGFGTAQCNVPALVIPIHDVRGEIRGHQIRPDAPRIVDGKAIKYETPRGSAVALDVPPAAQPKLRDPSIPLFVTEGIRKGDSGVSHGLCVIGLLGVTTWRGTNDVGGKTALAEWEYVALNGRQVYIVFDSDVTTKPQVRAALFRLKSFLERRDAKVSIVHLEPNPDGSKVGLDDFFAAGGTVAKLLSRADGSMPEAPLIERDPTYFTENGMTFWRKTTKDGTVDVPLASFVAKVTHDISEDDGETKTRVLAVEVTAGKRTVAVRIAPARFNQMSWPMEEVGADALVHPGMTVRDHLRFAILQLSLPVSTATVFTHMGWTLHGGHHVYLHAGGALGGDGPVHGVEVRLPADLRRFELPPPLGAEELASAIKSEIAGLAVAPLSITVPLLGAIYRAILGDVDFGVHLTGETGARKSELAALAQQHFGADMTARDLPANWSGTGNALELLAFTVKDGVLVIDDFAPGGAAADVARLHREADRLFRGLGNGSGRQRMTADLTLANTKRPRGLILSTGEDTPRGHSIRARVLILEVPRGAVDLNILSARQEFARSGKAAGLMSAYIAWVAGRKTGAEVCPSRNAIRARRAEFEVVDGHGRTPEILVNIMVGLETFLAFAVGVGAVREDEARALTEHWKGALLSIGNEQADHQRVANPAHQFVRMLGACLTSGRAHLTSMSDGVPAAPAERFGWRRHRDELQPSGRCIGWVDGDDVYLDPEAAFAEAQTIARESGEPFAVSFDTLKRRLFGAGLLSSIEESGGKRRLVVRRSIAGTRREVLHVAITTILEGEGLVLQVCQGHQPPQAPTDDGERGLADSGDGPAEAGSPDGAHGGVGALGTPEPRDEEPSAHAEPPPYSTTQSFPEVRRADPGYVVDPDEEVPS